MTNSESKNFGLSEEQFSRLLEQLHQGDETLFEHAFLQHFSDCRNYLEREDGVKEDLAYDATMDAFLAFREYLGRGKIGYGNLRFLLTRMARQCLYKRLGKERDVSMESAQIPEPLAEEELEESSLETLQEGWRLLDQKCQRLLRKIFYAAIPMVQIARQEGRKETAVRKQKERCVQKLRGVMAGTN